MSARLASSRGLILGELIVVLVISSIVMTALLAGLVALLRGMHPQAITVAGERLPIAPTFGSFPSAVRLHQSLTERVSAARAIYVFGGKHVSIPATAPEAALPPLQADAPPVIDTFGAGLPLDAKGFYDAYAAQLGALDSDAAPDNFSVLILGATGSGRLGVTAFVQSRAASVTISDGAAGTPFIVREVKLWDVDAGLLRYAFAEKPSHTTGIFNGAVHTWLRYQAGAAAEEGPACVVFPDPWLYAGNRDRADDTPPFSRFSYFLAVSP